MAKGKIIAVHSYRGGTGKTNITVNLAVCFVRRGKRVAVLDTDLQSPGAHVLFGFQKNHLPVTLVDFLWGRCSLEETAYEVTSHLDRDPAGTCWLIPGSMTAEAITRILDEGYDVARLNNHFDQLLRELDLDYLLIDTHPGLNKETLLSTALADVLVILIRPDQQDFYGTAVLAEVASRLEVPHIRLVANKVLETYDFDELSREIEKRFGFEVIGMLPLSQTVARTASKGLFVVQHPEHEVSRILDGIAERLLAL